MAKINNVFAFKQGDLSSTQRTHDLKKKKKKKADVLVY